MFTTSYTTKITCVGDFRQIEWHRKFGHAKHHRLTTFLELPNRISSYTGYWGVEVSFNQDQSRIRPGFLGQYLVVIRHLLLKLEKTLKWGIIVKRNWVGWDNRYLEKRLELVVPAR